MYNALRINFDLPHMRNKLKFKDRPCLHICFGETLAQLSSICLSSHAIQILNTMHVPEVSNLHALKMTLLRIFNQVEPESFFSLLNVSHTESFQSILNTNLDSHINSLINKTIDSCFFMYSEFLPAETVKNLITNFKQVYWETIRQNGVTLW